MGLCHIFLKSMLTTRILIAVLFLCQVPVTSSMVQGWLVDCPSSTFGSSTTTDTAHGPLCPVRVNTWAFLSLVFNPLLFDYCLLSLYFFPPFLGSAQYGVKQVIQLIVGGQGCAIFAVAHVFYEVYYLCQLVHLFFIAFSHLFKKSLQNYFWS